jgi:hypothetical protein
MEYVVITCMWLGTIIASFVLGYRKGAKYVNELRDAFAKQMTSMETRAKSEINKFANKL